MDGKLCLGNDILIWKTGEVANFGNVFGIENCKLLCNQHFECLGFQYLKDLDSCGFWKTFSVGKLEIDEEAVDDPNQACYKKCK